MTRPGPELLRRAGNGRLPDGARVSWSVAAGGRGRRWRWTVTEPDGALRHAGLIERDAAGGFARLELANPAGLLTFHPAGDGVTAHGNVVRPDRVDPIEVPWRDGDDVAIDGDPFGSMLGHGTGVGEGWSIGRGLELRPGTTAGLPIDARGVPMLADATEWALETD